MDRAGSLAKCPATPAETGIGHHRHNRQAGSRCQRRHARLQRQQRRPVRPWCPRGRSRSGVRSRTARSPSRISPRSADAPPARSTAIMPVDRDQRAEQRDPQQLLLQHVATARHQNEPYERVERRLVSRGDQHRRRPRAAAPGRITSRRMPQITRSPPTTTRAQSLATSNARCGAHDPHHRAEQRQHEGRRRRRTR